jgi:hypothetical protein
MYFFSVRNTLKRGSILSHFSVIPIEAVVFLLWVIPVLVRQPSSVRIITSTNPNLNKGKTTFLFYLLFHRLSSKLPTAMQTHREMFFLFTKDGASIHSATSDDVDFPAGTWALADSNTMIKQPCDAFLSASMQDVWIVQATSPLKERWHGWIKDRFGTTYIMDVFPPNELRTLG